MFLCKIAVFAAFLAYFPALRAEEYRQELAQVQLDLLLDRDFKVREEATQALAKLLRNDGVYNPEILKMWQGIVERNLEPEMADRLNRPEIIEAILWQEINEKAKSLKDMNEESSQEARLEIEKDLMQLGSFVVPSKQIDKVFGLVFGEPDDSSTSILDGIVYRQGFRLKAGCKGLSRVAWVWSYWFSRNAYSEIERHSRCEDKTSDPYFWKAAQERYALVAEDKDQRSRFVEHLTIVRDAMIHSNSEAHDLLKAILPGKGSFSSDEISLLTSLWECKAFDIDALRRFIDELIEQPELNYYNFQNFRGDHKLFGRMEKQVPRCAKDQREALAKALVDSYKKVGDADFKTNSAGWTLQFTYMRLLLMSLSVGHKPDDQAWKFFNKFFSDAPLGFLIDGLKTIFTHMGAEVPDLVKHDLFAELLRTKNYDFSLIAHALLPLLKENYGPWTQEITDLILGVFKDSYRAPRLVELFQTLELHILPRRLMDALMDYEVFHKVPMIAADEIVKKK